MKPVDFTFFFSEYPDKSSYAVAQINSKFVYRINDYTDLWRLKQVVDAFNSKGVRPNITIPCLIDAQADRRFNIGESFGLKLVLDFLSQMDAHFTIFHPHNPELVGFALPNAVILYNSMYVKQVLDDIGVYNNVVDGVRADISNTILMSSDAGGFKPLMKLCDKINWQGDIYSASKSRKWVDGKSVITQLIDKQDFGGKDVIIVDDLCIYGGTFKGLSKLLRERNVGKLYLIVSHMTVPDLGNDPVTDYFDTVYTTNSKYDYYSCKNETVTPPNLKIINVFS